MHRSAAAHQNHILEALPKPVLGRLRSHLMPLSLPAKTVLYERHGRIDFVFFPLSGLISSVAGASERIEVGLIGREGMTGLSAVLGVDTSPHECFVQISGEAIRISAPELMQAFEAEADLRKRSCSRSPGRLLQTANTPSRSDWRVGSSCAGIGWTATRFL